ncbi:MAG: hypothetical protein LBL04_12930 [Bacteroidales bacterium]|jgi:TonB-dependent SusC/RagA subfamily outer membrane receptor|nr:hypothetical protein [Bacteroidales bacterium]
MVTTKNKNPVTPEGKDFKENAPLYIVDGKEMSSIGNSPENIQSMTILKDQSAIRLYGKKARNGVVVITTKNKNPVIHGWKDFGESAPLYIVNGKETSSIGNISPENIQSMTILKDQSAISMFGEKARDGVVVIITTKK